MSSKRNAQHQSVQLEEVAKEGIPACQSCRRKKAKCNREQPCSQCVRFKVLCVYDNCRIKPGLRTGAVEHLQRRVETLESMFIGQGLLWQKVWDAVNGSNSHSEISRTSSERGDLTQISDQLKDSLLQLAKSDIEPSSQLTTNDEPNAPPAKRRKVESPSTSVEQPSPGQVSSPYFTNNELPPKEVVDELVEFYFANVHHWIPILHVKNFRQQISTREGRSKAIHILHAIVATCIRFTNTPSAGSDDSKTQMAIASRQRVILKSMESFSVENLQALVIIAFDTVCMLVPSPILLWCFPQ